MKRRYKAKCACGASYTRYFASDEATIVTASGDGGRVCSGCGSGGLIFRRVGPQAAESREEIVHDFTERR